MANPRLEPMRPSIQRRLANAIPTEPSETTTFYIALSFTVCKCVHIMVISFLYSLLFFTVVCECFNQKYTIQTIVTCSLVVFNHFSVLVCAECSAQLWPVTDDLPHARCTAAVLALWPPLREILLALQQQRPWLYGLPSPQNGEEVRKVRKKSPQGGHL